MGSWSNRRVSARPMGKGKLIGCEGALEEQNRRTAAAIQNDAFVAALHKARQEELRTAMLVEREMHKVPTREEMSVFEKQMARLKAGAALVEVRPFNRRGDPAYSLTGCAAGMVAL